MQAVQVSLSPSYVQGSLRKNAAWDFQITLTKPVWKRHVSF